MDFNTRNAMIGFLCSPNIDLEEKLAELGFVLTACACPLWAQKASIPLPSLLSVPLTIHTALTVIPCIVLKTSHLTPTKTCDSVIPPSFG